MQLRLSDGRDGGHALLRHNGVLLLVAAAPAARPQLVAERAQVGAAARPVHPRAAVRGGARGHGPQVGLHLFEHLDVGRFLFFVRLRLRYLRLAPPRLLLRNRHRLLQTRPLHERVRLWRAQRPRSVGVRPRCVVSADVLRSLLPLRMLQHGLLGGLAQRGALGLRSRLRLRSVLLRGSLLDYFPLLFERFEELLGTLVGARSLRRVRVLGSQGEVFVHF